MIDLLQGPGFLGTNGTLGADISLVLSLLAACLSAVLVLAWMVRSFVVYVGGSK